MFKPVNYTEHVPFGMLITKVWQVKKADYCSEKDILVVAPG